MKGLVKLADYSITGGIFLLNLFLFATLIDQLIHHQQIEFTSIFATWQHWLDALAKVTATANQGAIQSALSALAAALSIILIFCTGLMLDLLAPVFFAIFEMLLFKRWLASEDRQWMGRIIAGNQELVQADFDAFVGAGPIRWLLDFGYFLKHRHHFMRLRSFILSYIFVKASGAKLDDLIDQIRVWEISRAISMAMLLQVFLNGGYAFIEAKLSGWAFFAVAGGQIGLFLVTVLIVLATTSRLRATLCSLLYLTGGAARS